MRNYQTNHFTSFISLSTGIKFGKSLRFIASLLEQKSTREYSGWFSKLKTILPVHQIVNDILENFADCIDSVIRYLAVGLVVGVNILVVRLVSIIKM